jgi:hypothetical protein
MSTNYENNKTLRRKVNNKLVKNAKAVDAKATFLMRNAGILFRAAPIRIVLTN